MRNWPLRWKLTVSVAAGVLLLALGNVVLSRESADESMRVAARQAIREAAQAFARLERSDADKLAATLDALVANGAIMDRFVARDREKLTALAEPVFAGLRREHRITHWYFLEPPPARTCFLRVHKPELYGDRVDRVTYTKATDATGLGAGLELGKTGFALRVVKPYVRAGALVGYVELGEEIDHFLAEMAQGTSDAYALVLDKRFLDAKAWAEMRAAAGRRNDWDDLPHAVVVNATADDARIARYDADLAALPDDGVVLELLDRAASRVVRGAVPVRDAAGRKVGGLFVLHDVAGIEGALAASHRRALVALAALALASIAGVLLLARGVTRPLERLTHAAGAMARGDLTGRIGAAGRDEVGRLGRSFGALADGLRALVGELHGTADALGTQAEQLLGRASSQSAGASEQAAAIHQTTASLAEIAQTSSLARGRAEHVIETATRSEALAERGQDAVARVVDGIEKLGAQVAAIGAANAALAERALRIDEIVVTVKDVAEQSDVLALNASIEASRAGEAGRGFAIVASEMRRLSDQSRDAALAVRRLVAEIKSSARDALDAASEGNRRGTEAA